MQEQVVLTSIPVSELMKQLREIIREEIVNHNQKQLQERLLSPAEACELLGGISKPTLWSWEKSGRIRKHTIGGRVFYKYGELMASLDCNTRKRLTLETIQNDLTAS